MPRRIPANELQQILDDHELWIRSAFRRGRRADFTDCDLSGRNLRNRNLSGARFRNAVLQRANLVDTIFHGSNLDGADLAGAKMFDTVFRRVDLSRVKGLDQVIHHGPSTIGIDTLYRSRFRISEAFLRGAGVPESALYSLPLLRDTPDAGLCFISYSHEDELFARRLQAGLLATGITVWFAPVNLRGGRKLFDQVIDMIRESDRLLVILSPHSMRSSWVITELRYARRIEAAEGRRMLFPIRIVDFDVLSRWTCFDSDRGVDLAAEIREYFIPDFSNWQNPKAFQRACARLVTDLRQSGK